jgi:hypothetical protein
MEKNNDFIDLQSNSKRSHVEVDFANLPKDHCFRKYNCKFYLYVLKHNFVELFTYSVCYNFVQFH